MEGGGGGLQGCSGPKIRDHGGGYMMDKERGWGLRSFSYTVVVEEGQRVFHQSENGGN